MPVGRYQSFVGEILFPATAAFGFLLGRESHTGFYWYNQLAEIPFKNSLTENLFYSYHSLPSKNDLFLNLRLLLMDFWLCPPLFLIIIYLMRQNQNIKVEEERSPIELVECDSSDISESHTLGRTSTITRDYLHEMVVRARQKLMIQEIDLHS